MRNVYYSLSKYIELLSNSKCSDYSKIDLVSKCQCQNPVEDTVEKDCVIYDIVDYNRVYGSLYMLEDITHFVLRLTDYQVIHDVTSKEDIFRYLPELVMNIVECFGGENLPEFVWKIVPRYIRLAACYNYDKQDSNMKVDWFEEEYNHRLKIDVYDNTLEVKMNNVVIDKCNIPINPELCEEDNEVIKGIFEGIYSFKHFMNSGYIPKCVSKFGDWYFLSRNKDWWAKSVDYILDPSCNVDKTKGLLVDWESTTGILIRNSNKDGINTTIYIVFGGELDRYFKIDIPDFISKDETLFTLLIYCITCYYKDMRNLSFELYDAVKMEEDSKKCIEDVYYGRDAYNTKTVIKFKDIYKHIYGKDTNNPFLKAINTMNK